MGWERPGIVDVPYGSLEYDIVVYVTYEYEIMRSSGETNIPERLPRASGRPRKPTATQDILQATLAILAEKGFAALTIEAIARRANVGRPALYRRWPSKEAIVEEAFAEVFKLGVPIPDTGSLTGDLTYLVNGLTVFLQTQVGRIIISLIGEGLREPSWQRFSTRFGQIRRERSRIVITRAIERGELPPDVDGDLLLDLMLSVQLLGHLVDGRTLEPARAQRMIDMVLNGTVNAISPPA
jgi:AcrR family transcriptional regulator